MVAPGSDVLDRASRAGALARMAAADSTSPLDVLVVGGGVVGCGSALDAAQRGLSVALVERHDLASGTSSRSSRLAHGGLRYLEQREFSLVHEALTERGLLLDRLAPHLVRPVPFLYPVTRRGWERPYVGFGITVYDMLSRLGAYGGAMPRPKTLSAKIVKGIAPGIKDDALVGAVRFHDAQIDDARHTVAVARTAAAHGAAIATRTSVVRLIREDGRVVGAVIRDELTGREFDVRARVVLGAAGVWTDDLLEMAGAASQHAVRQSKGIHLVVPREAFPSTSALIARTPTSVLFLLPWGRHWLIGTTDTDYSGPRSEPQVDEADVEYLLAEANKWLAKPLTRDDVVGVYSGLRPLLSAGTQEDGTATLSREHAVLRPAPGLVLIAGGKYTTYRVMAADAVDAAVTSRAEVVTDIVPPSKTDELPLVGAAGYTAAWATRERTAREAGLSLAAVEHLLRRHGDRARTVLDLIASDPKLAEPMHPDSPYLLAEGVVAITREGALGLDDVLVRRTRLALETRGGGVDVAASVAEVLAPYANWNEADISEQVAVVAQRRDALQPVPGGQADQQVVAVDDSELPGDSVEAALLEEVEFATGLPVEGPSA
ncbi:MAG: glycerol-3-phosphate dehydrogenase/oxidase [Candidatus Nanopelagicales bacterium]